MAPVFIGLKLSCPEPISTIPQIVIQQRQGYLAQHHYLLTKGYIH